MNDDAALLRKYAGERSEAAFTELVRRHVDVVYATALRRTDGNTHMARDVAQQVFSELARRADKLSRYAVLGAWLHTATRNAAINLMISEKRRRIRETEALSFTSDSAPAGASPDWDRVRPVLDEAIDELPEQDRTAIVLRFLERQSFAVIGGALRVSEDAARMRTDRALEKLRTQLGRRGITSSTAALTALVTGQPAVSAPAGFAAALASQALAPLGAAMAAPTLFSIMNAKLITAAAVTALVFFGLGRQSAPSPVAAKTAASNAPTEDSQKIIKTLRAENAQLRSDMDGLTAAANDLLAKQSAIPAQTQPAVPDLTTQRSQAMMNNLRQIGAAMDQFTLETGQRPTSLSDIVGADKYIKALRTIDGEDYSQLQFSSESLTVTAADGTSVSYNIGPVPTPMVAGGGRSGVTVSRFPLTPEQAHASELLARIQPAFQKAVQAYQAANGRRPATPADLSPSYFESPQDAADYAEALLAIRLTAPSQP